MNTFFFEQVFTGTQWQSNVLVKVSEGLVSEWIPDSEPMEGAHYFSKVALGTIDLQVNGGGGVLLNQSPSPAALSQMMSAHAQFGTTAMLPTLITDDVSVIEATADAIAKSIARQLPGVLGIHFEGPHLSVAKKGTHAGEKIRPISEREWAVYERDDLGVKLITLAPESVSVSDIKRMVRAEVKVFIGHSNASYDQTRAALDAGAVGFTHLYNAMSPFTSREAGVVGAALLDEHSWCGVINDGHHVSNEALKIALRMKPRGKVVLVTDAMSLIGTDDHQFKFFDRTVYRDGDRLTSTTGELAGSHLDFITAIRRTNELLGVGFDEAWRMASVYPAQCLGLSQRTELGLGACASWVHLSEDNSRVLTTVIDGQIVYRAK